MYEKVIRMYPVSKLSPYTKRSKRNSIAEYQKTGVIDISSFFWDKLFYSDDFIKRDAIVTDGIFLGEDRIDTAMSIFQNIESMVPDSKEMVFIYDTFLRVIAEFNRCHPQWSLSIAYGLSHAFSRFNPQQINLTRMESAIADGGGAVGKMLNELVEDCDITDSIVIFKFFWPTDLLQLFFISEKLKARNNVIIVDVTQANEQSDFSQWIETFTKHSETSKWFDYMVVYEDYGQAGKRLISHIQSGWKGTPPEIASNIVYIKENQAHFQELEESDPDTLFRTFCEYYHHEWMIFILNSLRSAQWRLFPYRCYWSSCFFCTINSTNPYRYQKENRRYIEACVDFIEKNNIQQIFFGDEAIHVNDILLFSQLILERKISVVYRFRTRFDLGYTQEVCQILAQAGARFCGIGLECASDRVSNLINKGSNMTIKDKTNIITNFERAGIPFHNYSIFWLPWENADESYETYLFLKKNIELRNNYTCTPNLFGLNKGSMYYKHPEKFNIQLLDDESTDVLLSVWANFMVNTKAHMARLKYIRDIHALQFLSFYNPVKVMKFGPMGFWDFIDRSGVYYTIKSFSRSQPFRYPKKESIDFSALLDKCCDFGKYIEWMPFENGGYFTNITNGYSVFVPSSEGVKLYQEWDSRKNISENISSLAWQGMHPEITQTIIQAMLAHEILTVKPRNT